MTISPLTTASSRLARVPWLAVVVYIVIACALAWLVLLPLWLSGGTQAPMFDIFLSLLASAMMFTPALAVLAVIPMLGVPRGQRLRFLGVWPLRPARRLVWFTVAALFAPAGILAVVTFVSAALGLVHLDLQHFSGFQAIIDDSLATLDTGAASVAIPVGLLVALQLLSIPFGAVFNMIFTFGEEIGWRGLLLPALRPLGIWPALLITGVIWGLWHSPVILLGYNFGYTDWRGVALMTAGCVAWGVLLGWTRLRSASVWPATAAHGGLNASASLVILFGAAGETANLSVVGPLGIVAWVVTAALAAVLAATGQFRTEPELQQVRSRTPEAAS